MGEGKKLIQIQYSSIYSIYRHKTVDLTTMLFCLLFLFVCFLFVWSDSSSLYSQSRSVHTKLLLRRHRQAIQGQAIQVKNLKRNLEQKVSHLPYLVGMHYANFSHVQCYTVKSNKRG